MTNEVPRYDELKLRIAPGPGVGYQVAAFGPDGSAASGAFTLPFDQTQLENFVLRVARRRSVRAYRSSQMEEAKRFGSKLFDALIGGEIRDVYLSARRAAEQKERGLRVTLYLTDVPELMEVPWEFLYERPSFLSQSVFTPVVRSLDLRDVRPPRKVTPPLRILGVVSQPRGVEMLDADRERDKLGKALSELERDGTVELRWLERATLTALDDAISATDDVHVLHYIGHGAYDDRTEGGIVVLEDAHGAPHEVTGEELGSLIQDERSLRLVVLNSCEGARGSHVDPFSGVASSLVEYQIPAVIGMQFEITDEAAVTFASRLYTALARGFPVDAALAQARKAIFAAGSDIEFGTPVLFLRAGDGRLFDLERPPVGPPRVRDEADLTLNLNQDTPEAKPGERVAWQLMIENSGGSGLRQVTARGTDGEALAEPVELRPGGRHIVRWIEPLEPGLRQLITVTAVDYRGSSISRQVGATAVAITPEAEEQARREAEEQARREAEEQARREAEEQARREAEEQARREAEEQARREAEEQARREAEEQARREAEEQARREAEEQARREAEEQARREAEEQARREAEEQARREAEEQARREAEEQARREAEEQARREAEEQARGEAEEHITSLQDELRLHAEARNWAAVLAVSDQLATLDPDASDIDGLVTTARQQLAQQARREAEEQARREAEEQERREAEEHITSLQDELRLHAEARNWAAVLAVSDQLATLDPDASDIDGLVTTARQQLAQQARREAEEQARREAEEQARREAEEQARREAEELASAGRVAAEGVASKGPDSQPNGLRSDLGVASEKAVVGSWMRQHRLMSGVVSIAVIAGAAVAIILGSTHSTPRTPPPTAPPGPTTSSTSSSSSPANSALQSVLTKYVPAGVTDCSSLRSNDLTTYGIAGIICYTAPGAGSVVYNLWSSSADAHGQYDQRLSGNPGCSAATMGILSSYKGGGATCDLEDNSGDNSGKKAYIYWSDDKNKTTGELSGNDANDHALALTWRGQYIASQQPPATTAATTLPTTETTTSPTQTTPLTSSSGSPPTGGITVPCPPSDGGNGKCAGIPVGQPCC